MSTLEANVLPLKESRELAEKGIFKAAETAFSWIQFYKGKEFELYPSHYPVTNSCHADCRHIIPAPTLEEMCRKLNGYFQWDYSCGKDTKLAAFALLMEKKNE